MRLIHTEPCQDIYPLRCKLWAHKGLCDAKDDAGAHFFRDNCALSCEQCVFVNETIVSGERPMPPMLAPLAWLVGSWMADETYDNVYFPVDFPAEVRTYAEQINITVADHLYLSRPALQFASFAVSKQNAQELREAYGYITVSMKATGELTATVTTTTNEGITVIEEGPISNSSVRLTPQYVGGPPSPRVSAIFDVNVERSFGIESIWLRQKMIRRINGLDYPTSKYYAKVK